MSSGMPSIQPKLLIRLLLKGLILVLLQIATQSMWSKWQKCDSSLFSSFICGVITNCKRRNVILLLVSTIGKWPSIIIIITPLYLILWFIIILLALIFLLKDKTNIALLCPPKKEKKKSAWMVAWETFVLDDLHRTTIKYSWNTFYYFFFFFAKTIKYSWKIFYFFLLRKTFFFHP